MAKTFTEKEYIIPKQGKNANKKIPVLCIKQENPGPKGSYAIISAGKRKWGLVVKHIEEIKAFVNEEEKLEEVKKDTFPEITPSPTVQT